MIFDEIIVELIAAGGNINEMNKVARLLITLPNTYDAVVTAIQTLSDESLNIAFVKTRLLDYEIKLKNEANETSGKVLQIYVNNHIQNESNRYNRQSKNSKKFKNHRNQKYKSQKQPNYSFKNYNKSNIQCEHCGRKNHEKKDCYFYKNTFHPAQMC